MEYVIVLKKDLTEEQIQNIITIIDNMDGVLNIYIK